MATDTSKFIPADKLDLEQQPIDMKAPILLRPLGDDPADKRNWVLKAIERTGQPLDTALETWAFGFALETDLMWSSTVEYKGEEEALRHQEEVWRRIPEKYKDAARKVFTWSSETPPYGLTLEIGADEIASRLGHVEGGRARPLEPRLHRPRPPDVARLGGLLRRARGPDHVLPGVGGLRARLPGRDQGRRRHGGVQDDRRPRPPEPRLLGGDRVRGRGRREDGGPLRRRRSRPARSSTTWSTCTARRRPAR